MYSSGRTFGVAFQGVSSALASAPLRKRGAPTSLDPGNGGWPAELRAVSVRLANLSIQFFSHNRSGVKPAALQVSGLLDPIPN